LWARLEDLFPCTPSPHAGTGKVGRVGLRPTAPLDRSAREPGVKQGDGPVSLQLTLQRKGPSPSFTHFPRFRAGSAIEMR